MLCHPERSEGSCRHEQDPSLRSDDISGTGVPMKVLVADKFEKVGIDGLKELGCSVVSQPDLTAEALPGAVKEVDPHILIVRGTKVTADDPQGGHRPHAGDPRRRRHRHDRRGRRLQPRHLRVQLSRQELDRRRRAGDGPGARRCDRRIPDQVADLRQGKWSKGEYSKARGLYGRTLGIVGLGQIGREVAGAGAGVRDAGASPGPVASPTRRPTASASPTPKCRSRWRGSPTPSRSTWRPTRTRSTW